MFGSGICQRPRQASKRRNAKVDQLHGLVREVVGVEAAVKLVKIRLYVYQGLLADFAAGNIDGDLQPWC